MIRIITGSQKGKKLKTLEGDTTRPTSERIKEAVFSSIQFDIEGRRVLDLFGGCGQLGLEAMSRGATGVMFVDSSAEAVALIKENATATGFFSDCRYLVSDYRNYLRKAAGKDAFSLIFLDPPYGMACCGECVKKLLDTELAIPGALIVCESGEEVIDFSDEPRVTVLKAAQYGKKTALHILLVKDYAPASGDESHEN